MLQFLAKNLYLVVILIILFTFLYIMGGDDIVFFRRKKYPMDPKATENLRRVLDRFASSRDYKVLGPTTLEFGGQMHHFDAILLSLYGTVAFKAAPWAGEIYADPGEETWLQVFEGRRGRFDDPTKSLEGVGRFFRDLYRSEGVKYGRTDSMVVFTDRKVSVAVSKMLPVCMISDLNARMERDYLADHGADIAGMKLALEKYTK